MRKVIVYVSVSAYETMSKVIDDHGGIAVYQNVPFEISKTNNIKQGKEHPFVLIPERCQDNPGM